MRACFSYGWDASKAYRAMLSLNTCMHKFQLQVQDAQAPFEQGSGDANGCGATQYTQAYDDDDKEG